MIPMLVLASLAADPGFRVIETLTGDDLAPAGLAVDIVERPSGIGNVEFAERLIAAEGLRAVELTPSLPAAIADDRMDSRAAWAADGHNVIVFFAVPSSPDRPGRLCRIRAASSLVSPARYRALRWCAASFGVDLPETPPPAVLRR